MGSWRAHEAEDGDSTRVHNPGVEKGENDQLNVSG